MRLGVANKYVSCIRVGPGAEYAIVWNPGYYL